ncbi:Chitin biosynthesis protein [Wickerhamomyces ciferrii]|uniref:Chitin biosynthesis protein CHS5 n=1 Tax=Wickerhamomyces ciferrii (strain ATCC 14091 / BCRC 22168 / CBS 111 / JCM 3599 / NBRC 0793 / NRRL Y-1031 F-60-10) TaxID=1206466 RepID=K0KKH5_WICCF|nr:Chitin biosynthesis protein [Wickerhamomyces ciferrii]CCH45710.1 Chitin biosynthesis protein [Wickerhamomyces ciferrii]
MVEVSLTVGKLDASLALLLTKDHHLIEFPTVLLPNGVNAGSVVTIKCEQDLEQEAEEKKAFEDVQEQILELFGKNEPKAPILKIKNVTQTSAVLEWDQLDLGSANIKSLTLYKNNSRLGQIPNPLVNTTTKLSGLPIDTPYEFYLRLDTTAGIYQSETIKLRTHKMTDLSGITVCLGEIDPKEGVTREDIEKSLNNMGAKPLQDEVKVDTTHFICTNGLGTQWKKALDSNIPVVRPEWLKASETERRIIGVRNFYLDADPQILEQHRFKKENSESQPIPQRNESLKAEEPVSDKVNGETNKDENVTSVPENDLEDVPIESTEQLPKPPVEETKEEPKEELKEESKKETSDEQEKEFKEEPKDSLAVNDEFEAPKEETPIAVKDEAESEAPKDEKPIAVKDEAPKEESKSEIETPGPVATEPIAEEKVSTSNPEDAEKVAEEEPEETVIKSETIAAEDKPVVEETSQPEESKPEEIKKEVESIPVEESKSIEPPTEELKEVSLNDPTSEEPTKENGEENDDEEEDGEDEEPTETNGEASKPAEQTSGANKKKKKNNKKKKGKK